MSHARALARGHRRAASCYNLDFDNIDNEKKPQQDLMKTNGTSSCQSLESFDFFEYFAKPKYEGGGEKSIILDTIESSTLQKQRKELGLKFSSINRVLKDFEKSPAQKGRSSTREAECFDSPKSTQSRERLQKIQVKYVTDLQRIDEDLHEFSLANSRNSLNLKNSAQKALARIVRASGSGRKILGDIPVCSNLILEEFELEKTKDYIETDFQDQRLFFKNGKVERVTIEERNLNGDLSKVIVTKSTMSSNLQNSHRSCQSLKGINENLQKNDAKMDISSKFQQSSSALVENIGLPESTKTPRHPKMNYFMNNNFQPGAKLVNSQGINGNHNHSLDNSIQLIDKGAKLIHNAKAEMGGRSCLKTTLQRLYNERNRKSSNNPGIKNIINLNLTKQIVHSNSRDKSTSRPLTPTMTKADSKVHNTSLAPRGSDNSSSRSAIIPSKRRMPSEVCLERFKENIPDPKQKRLSASISVKQSRNSIPKSTSSNSCMKKTHQSSDAQDCSVSELKKIISTQQATLTYLKTKVLKLETENRSINTRYFKLKQENKQLQMELNAALATNPNTTRGYKALSSKTDGPLSIR